MEEPQDPIGRFSGFGRNWRDYDAPFATKLRLFTRNYWMKMRTLSMCCGNHGEPGC